MTSLLRIKQIVGCKKTGIPALIPVSESTWWAGVKAGRFTAEVDWQTHHMLERIRFTQINEWLHISASIGNSTM